MKRMVNNIRVEGIYDKRTLKLIDELGVQALSFDFRPRSLNFIQQYLFLDLIKDIKSLSSNFFIQYENEPDFMINDTLEKLDKIYSGPVTLEFSDNQSCEYYDSFQRPFYWHYRDDCRDISVFQSPYLKGIILDFETLREKHESGSFHSFVQNFYRLSHKCLLEGEGELILKLGWNSNVFPSIFEYLDIDGISLPVDQNVEICYRNVDHNKLSQGVKALCAFTNS